MTPTTVVRQAVLGVDTHQRTHHAALVTPQGEFVADASFPATATGYDQLWAWTHTHATELTAAGVESSSSYGAGLARRLTEHHIPVFEVNAPSLPERYAHGKSDRLDACAAALAVVTGRAQALAKDTHGIVESIRMLYVARASAVEEATRIGNQIRDLFTTAPAAWAATCQAATTTSQRLTVITDLPPAGELCTPAHAFIYTVRSLQARYVAARTEVAALSTQLAGLLQDTVPTLLSRPHIGTITAARLLITIGQNADRMRTEATFAKLVGVAPLPASSGKTSRHRLNRGGDRTANSALHLIVVGRMKSHPPTRAYVQRRSTENRTKKDIIRCLKRYVAREVYKDLTTDLGKLDNL